MENYSKGENVDIELKVFVPGCTKGATRIVVSPSTKMRDIITIALDSCNSVGYERLLAYLPGDENCHGKLIQHNLLVSRLKTEEQLLWIGSGPAAVKAVSCVEVVKRRIKTLHQITQLTYKTVEEYWNPKLEGLDRLKVTREVPTIVILLSKQPLDPSVPGYQLPGSLGDDFCKHETQQRRRYKEPRSRYEDKSGTSRYYKDQTMTHEFRGESSDVVQLEEGDMLRFAQGARGRGGYKLTSNFRKQSFGGSDGGGGRGKRGRGFGEIPEGKNRTNIHENDG